MLSEATVKAQVRQHRGKSIYRFGLKKRIWISKTTIKSQINSRYLQEWQQLLQSCFYRRKLNQRWLQLTLYTYLYLYYKSIYYIKSMLKSHSWSLIGETEVRFTSLRKTTEEERSWTFRERDTMLLRKLQRFTFQRKICCRATKHRAPELQVKYWWYVQVIWEKARPQESTRKSNFHQSYMTWNSVCAFWFKLKNKKNVWMWFKLCANHLISQQPLKYFWVRKKAGNVDLVWNLWTLLKLRAGVEMKTMNIKLKHQEWGPEFRLRWWCLKWKASQHAAWSSYLNSKSSLEGGAFCYQLSGQWSTLGTLGGRHIFYFKWFQTFL